MIQNGKESVAREIHRHACGDSAPFVRVSCEASEEAELEQDLFASDGGLLLAAEGGTIFLDEVGSLSLRLQSKLLNILETDKFRIRGSLDERDLNLRFLCSSRKDLEELVDEGEFN